MISLMFWSFAIVAIVAVIIVATSVLCKHTKNYETPIQLERSEDAADMKPVPIVNETITCPYCHKTAKVGNSFDHVEITCDRCNKIIQVAQPPVVTPSKDIRDILFDAYDKARENQI